MVTRYPGSLVKEMDFAGMTKEKQKGKKQPTCPARLLPDPCFISG